MLFNAEKIKKGDVMDLMTTDENAAELHIHGAVNGVTVHVDPNEGFKMHTLVFNDPDEFSKFVVSHFWGEEVEPSSHGEYHSQQWTKDEVIKIKSLDLPEHEVNKILALKQTE